MRSVLQAGAAALMALCMAAPLSSAAWSAPSGRSSGHVMGGGGGGHVMGGGGGPRLGGGGWGGGARYTSPSVNSAPPGVRPAPYNPVRPYVGGGYRGPGSVIPHKPGRQPGVHHGYHHGRKHHRHRRYSRFYTLPIYEGYDSYYDYSYGDSCSYLWRRWLATGNPKWKARYYDCID